MTVYWIAVLTPLLPGPDGRQQWTATFATTKIDDWYTARLTETLRAAPCMVAWGTARRHSGITVWGARQKGRMDPLDLLRKDVECQPTLTFAVRRLCEPILAGEIAANAQAIEAELPLFLPHREGPTDA